MKRILDIIVSLLVLSLTSPLFIIAILGIKLSSPGPLIYRARRVGVAGKLFAMYKFRTMKNDDNGSVITSAQDDRIFPFGKFLRKLKIDELPQFLNVLLGDMTIVGPRPEDPKIVSDAYTNWMLETLEIRPGITSPGALYYYAFSEQFVDNLDPEKSYRENMLTPKIAIDRAYMERANVFTDIVQIFKTVLALFGYVLGFKVLPASKDLDLAKKNWTNHLFGASDNSFDA